jgi:hypothetical protein
METQQKMIIGFMAALVLVAAYLALSNAPAKPADTTAAEGILNSSVAFGKGLGAYVYSFTETSNGYSTSYTLTKSADARMARIQNPLSVKYVYYLQNDTILCVSYSGAQACTSVKDDPRMENYLESISVKFFNDSMIQRNIDAKVTLSSTRRSPRQAPVLSPARP